MFKKLVSVIGLFLMMVSLAGCRQASSPAPSQVSPPVPSSAASLWNLDYGTVSYDRNGNQLWVARYNGPGNAFDDANAIAVDSAGNTYVTGGSMGSGNGTRYDYATVKYDKNGNQLWAARYHGPGYGDDTANAVAVDAGGDVYVTGQSTGSENNLVDYATVKYDTNGRQLWVARYNGPGNKIDHAQALAVDSRGNVYVTGGSRGTDSNDYATIKYDTNGNQLWVARYSANGTALAMALDNVGNVYVTGYGGTNSHDYITIKYDSNGNQLWLASYNGPRNGDDVAYSLAVDAIGNVYVTGRSMASSTSNYDYATVKYDGDGRQLWVARYDGPAASTDWPSRVAVDEAGNVYVTGRSRGTFDSHDCATIKYDTNGNQLWVARYADNSASDLAVDASGNVYVTGESGLSDTDREYATVKYDTNGNQLWASRYHGPGYGFGEARAIVVDRDGNTYVTGASAGSSGISEMTQCPWTDVSVYSDPSETIKIKTGDEFAFGFDTAERVGLSWDETHDETMVSLLDKEYIMPQPYSVSGKTWFLFKALKTGSSQVTFTYSHGGAGPVTDRKVFSIDIQ